MSENTVNLKTPFLPNVILGLPTVASLLPSEAFLEEVSYRKLVLLAELNWPEQQWTEVAVLRTDTIIEILSPVGEDACRLSDFLLGYYFAD